MPAYLIVMLLINRGWSNLLIGLFICNMKLFNISLGDGIRLESAIKLLYDIRFNGMVDSVDKSVFNIICKY